MKLALPDAYVPAVTNLMLNEGDDLVPASCIKLEAELDPKALEELRPGLRDKFFEQGTKPAIPSIPELAALSWKTEYEKGDLVLDLSETDGLDFKDTELRYAGVDVKAIEFEPLATGLVAFKANAIIRTDEKGRGKLTALVKHNVKATFSKLTQKVIEEEIQETEDDNQGELEITPLRPDLSTPRKKRH